MAYSLIWLPEILRAAKLKVAEQPGWATRGRGNIGTVRGVLCHHTAGRATGNMPSLNVITYGRPDLPGPLAHLGLGRDGTYYVIAAGRANHAGSGMWSNCSTGNSSFIGIEAENTGLADDPWPEVQMDAYRRGVAAILEKLGVDENWCCGHKEYARPLGRKGDPTFDMNEFRASVARVLSGEEAPKPGIPAIDPKNRPTLVRNARGPLVIEVQTKVKATPDGVFGPGTEAAVRAWQRTCGLVPDGIVGPKSWVELDKIPLPAPPAPAPTPAPVPAPAPVPEPQPS